MSLQAILAKIETDAEKQVEEIIQSAMNEKKEALHKVNSGIKEKHQKDTERIREKTKAYEVQMRSHAVRETERALLSYRRKIVDEVISDSVRKIASADDYLSLMTSLLLKCDLEGTVEVVICQGDVDRITSSFLKNLSTDKRQFVLAEEKHNDYGGVLMREGDISLNATLSMISELNHDSMVMELSRLLPLEGQVD